MPDQPATPTAGKKSVALSGIPAGNTAICTVGHAGNDLHYRGYDIADLAKHATFEEVAHLLIHERLPNRAELDAYRKRLSERRGIPAPVRAVLEQLPSSAHTMGVLRTACSAMGALEPELAPAGSAGPTDVVAAREIADRLLASFPSMLLYWHHFANSGKRIDVETDEP